MDLEWCTRLDVVKKKCPIVFRGHPSNFTVTQAENWRFESNLRLLGRLQLSNPSNLLWSRSFVKFWGQKIVDFDQNWVFPTVTPVWFHHSLWNNIQSLTWHRKGALLYFEVIYHIARSYGTKNLWSSYNLSKITRLVAVIKLDLPFLFSKLISCQHQNDPAYSVVLSDVDFVNKH